MVKQLLDLGLALKIDVSVRVSIASQELLDSQRPGRIVRTQEYRVSPAVSDEFHPAQDECAHENLAQLAIGIDQFL